MAANPHRRPPSATQRLQSAHELLIMKDKCEGSYSCSDCHNCILHLHQHLPDSIMEKRNLNLHINSTIRIHHFLINSSYFRMPSTATCSACKQTHLQGTFWPDLYGYCNISSQTPFAKMQSYTDMKIERHESDDEVKCWVSYNNYSLHSPLWMDGTVIMLASCRVVKYSSFLRCWSFSPPPTLALHIERL